MVIQRLLSVLEYALDLSEDEMKKIWIFSIGLLLTTSAFADSTNSSIGLQLPNAGSTYGEDSIRAGDLDCKNAIGGATQLEFGVTGIVDNYNSPFGKSSGESSKDVGVFARIVIPLDAPKESISCNSLYELELRKKRIEVLKLQEELEALKRLNQQSGSGFEN